MWLKPWRWLIALAAAFLVAGALNRIGMWLGASSFLGLPNAARLALGLGVAAVIDLRLLPPASASAPRESLPPLPAKPGRPPARFGAHARRTEMPARRAETSTEEQREERRRTG